jgi:hypothetical protein
MQIPKEALTPDGYINQQIKITNLIYDSIPVARTGCGPIAIYNVLKLIGKEEPFDAILKYFNKTTIHSIHLGSNFLQICGFMRKRNIKMKLITNKSKFNTTNVGILWYKHRGGWHYVAYVKGDNDKYIFYNVASQVMPVVDTMERFLSNYSVCNLCAVFEVLGA